MKKIIVLATMTIAISAIFCACNGSTSANTDQDSKETADVEAIVDEDLNELMGEISADVEAKDASALQSSIEAFKARIQALINAGNGEVAQKYLQSLQEFIETNKEEVTAISATVAESADASIADLVQKVAALPLDVAEGATKAAEGVANAAADKANEAVEATKAAAEAAKTDAENKANEAINAEKQKANEAIDAQKQKANDAVNKAAEDVKKSLGL